METPLVTLLATATLLGGRRALVLASLAAALRPEMLPWALCLALAGPAPNPQRRVLHVLLALSGGLVVALLRTWLFGQPAPLAVLAKPSDFDHGLRYALGGTVLCGLPLLLVAGRSVLQLDAWARTQLVAVTAHVGAIVIAGGDWMALFRLFVPILPACAWIAPQLMARQPRAWVWAKLLVATAACTVLTLGKLPAARGVLDARRLLLVESADLLVGRTVGTLDVGWVSAAEPLEVVDFAGVTDRSIALLPGGHTSKRLPADLLLRREVDTLVLLLAPNPPPLADGDPAAWRRLPFARTVEHRVAQLDGAEQFVPVRIVPLRGTEQSYLIVSRLGGRVARR
jgi:hypothetical protein